MRCDSGVESERIPELCAITIRSSGQGRPGHIPKATWPFYFIRSARAPAAAAAAADASTTATFRDTYQPSAASLLMPFKDYIVLTKQTQFTLPTRCGIQTSKNGPQARQD